MLKRAALATVCLLALCGPARAGYDEALSAAAEGNYEEALALWDPLANSGHRDAQYQLGRLYYFGLGTTRDFSQAALWFAEAARDPNHGRAQHFLGQMHYFGQGTRQDYKAAAEWFRLAADNGVAAAQHDLGIMYLEGQGMPKDLIQAYLWFSRAAEQGFPNAARRRDMAASRIPPNQLVAARGLGKSDPRASFRSGADFLKLDVGQQGYFVQGLADMLWETQMTFPQAARFEWTRNCLRNASANELVTMYTIYLQKRPEEKKFAAAETFMVMMQSTCMDLNKSLAAAPPPPPPPPPPPDQ